MTRSKAFLVVGHRNWGKSRTLRALTKEEHGWVTLHGKRFFVRLMSNDDVPTNYAKFIDALDPTKKPLMIAAYCPEQSPCDLIDAISQKYDLFMWVLQHNYACTRQISESEIATLQRFGKVERFVAERAEAAARGKALSRFVTANL